MDAPNPVAIVKSNLSLSKILGFAVLAVITFSILDLAGLTSWILFPVTTAKTKFGKK